MRVGLFISKDQHISLLQAPRPFLSPIFSLCPLSIHLSLSYSLANGKTVLGWILFFKGINSPLYTLDLTLWQALSVSSAWYRGLVFCVLMDTAHYHTQVQAHTHTKGACVHMSMHADVQPWHPHDMQICTHTHATRTYTVCMQVTIRTHRQILAQTRSAWPVSRCAKNNAEGCLWLRFRTIRYVLLRTN